jgi:hypothetical protein
MAQASLVLYADQRKAVIVARIVARAALLHELSGLGVDAQEVARAYTREQPTSWSQQLGLYIGLNKFSLAAQIIARTPAVSAAIAVELDPNG